MKLSGRIHAVALLGLLAVLAALLLLSQQARQARDAEMQVLRDRHLLGNLRTEVENQLAIGLQLDQLQMLQPVIAREQAAFAGVLAIDIFSAAGTVLYSTDVGNRGTPVPADWRQRLAGPQPWHSQAPGLRQIGERFDNDLGQPAGGIVVTFSTAPARAALAQWYQRGQLALRWLLLAAAVGLVTVVALRVGLRRLLRPYDDAARVLQGLPSAPAGSSGLVRAARRRRAQWDEARQRCQQGMRQLEALDHEA